MGNYIRVLLVEPGVPARIAVIDRSPRAVENLLGGNTIVVKYWDDDAIIVQNPEVLPSEDTLNRIIFDKGTVKDIIPGSFIVTQVDEFGNYASLSEELVRRYKRKFFHPDEFTAHGDGFSICHYEAVEGEGEANG